LLREASGVADEVYRPADVTIDWLDCTPALEGSAGPPDCEGEMRASLIVIQLVPEKMAKGVPVRGSVFGYAPLGAPDQLSHRATLFWDRIRDYCTAFATDAEALLGTAIAHEIGHLLLGPDKHSPGGMMRCPWRRQDVASAARGRLVFTPAELSLVREGARRRYLADSTPLSAP